MYAEGLFQRGPHGAQGGLVAGRLDAGQAVVGVGGEEPGHVPRLVEGRVVGEGAAEVFAEAGADVAGEGAGRFEAGLELVLGGGEAEGLEPSGVACGVLAQEDEVAGVGDEDEAVPVPVAADLGAAGGEPGVVGGGLDLDHAALGKLALAGPAAPDLLCGVEPEVGVARALVGKLAHAVDTRLQGRADGCEEVVEGRVVGAFAGCAAGGADAAQVVEVGFDGGGEVGHGDRVAQRGGSWGGGEDPAPPRHPHPSLPPSRGKGQEGPGMDSRLRGNDGTLRRLWGAFRG